MKTIKKIFSATAIVVLLAALAFGAIWLYVGTPFKGAEPTRVNVYPGTGNEALYNQLNSILGPDYGSKVATILKHSGGENRTPAGSYVVEPGMKAFQFARILKRGYQTPVKFTFNNIRTFGGFAARVGEIMETDSASFAAVCDSILPLHGFKPEEYPAAFVPDTYEFYWTAPPEKIVEKLVAERSKFWNDSRRAKALEIGLTPVQVATLASIVEEESNKWDERPTIARLYLNRLNKGMQLQADPTVKFAVGDLGLRRITSAHYNIDSPYNTYRIQGLPPGPIRIPEKRTLDAVLDAPANDYIYMCAKSDFSGYHDFTSDYNRHRINAARYHRALDKKGIK